jgi:hypothetical protein
MRGAGDEEIDILVFGVQSHQDLAKLHDCGIGSGEEGSVVSSYGMMWENGINWAAGRTITEEEDMGPPVAEIP